MHAKKQLNANRDLKLKRRGTEKATRSHESGLPAAVTVSDTEPAAAVAETAGQLGYTVGGVEHFGYGSDRIGCRCTAP